jgi:hypothetical protein
MTEGITAVVRFTVHNLRLVKLTFIDDGGNYGGDGGGFGGDGEISYPFVMMH